MIYNRINQEGELPGDYAVEILHNYKGLRAINNIPTIGIQSFSENRIMPIHVRRLYEINKTICEYKSISAKNKEWLPGYMAQEGLEE